MFLKKKKDNLNVIEHISKDGLLYQILQDDVGQLYFGIGGTLSKPQFIRHMHPGISLDDVLTIEHVNSRMKKGSVDIGIF